VEDRHRNILAPKVSIITPLFNSSPHIEKTLDSVLAQTEGDWELILIDDGSTDNTPQTVEPYLKDARFGYIRQANRGIAGARNTGIRAAVGQWICLLDHDDRWLPSKLEKQLAFALEGEFDLLGTDAVVITGDSRTLYSGTFLASVIDRLRLSRDDAGADVFELLIQCNFICSSSVMIRKSLFDRLGLLDETAAPADDYEMWLRCMPQAKIGFLDEPLIEYHLHEKNYSRDVFMMLNKELYALRKGRTGISRSQRHLDVFERRISELSKNINDLSRTTARAFLDEYHRVARTGLLSDAFPFLRKALLLSPSEVLMPRRLAAAIKRAVLSGFKSATRAR
jgi:glycosyltransferase involved in cell wall biosynthesis